MDCGSSGCRGTVIDADKTVRAQFSTAIEPPTLHGDRCSMDPRLWWRACEQVFTALSQQIDPGLVVAVSLDATSGTVLLADLQGLPLTPALMYNDRQAAAQASQIAAVAPPDSAAHGSGSGLAKWLFLQQSLPPQRRHNAVALHHQDWLCGRLCGDFRVSDENNALKFGYDNIRRQWPAWLARLGLDRQRLPRVVTAGTQLGKINHNFCIKLGYRHARLYAGTTDSVAATVASGASRIADGVTSLGSTMVIKLLSDKPVFSANHGVYSHRLGDTWLAGGASNTGGAVLRHFFNTASLKKLSKRIDPKKASGLDYYPLLSAGERFPVNDRHWPPRLHPRPTDEVCFLHGLLEGMARIESRGYQLLHELGAPAVRRVISAGGGAGNSVWRSIRRQLLGIPVTVAVHEQASYGAALIAWAGFHHEPVFSLHD